MLYRYSVNNCYVLDNSGSDHHVSGVDYRLVATVIRVILPYAANVITHLEHASHVLQTTLNAQSGKYVRE